MGHRRSCLASSTAWERSRDACIHRNDERLGQDTHRARAVRRLEPSDGWRARGTRGPQRRRQIDAALTARRSHLARFRQDRAQEQDQQLLLAKSFDPAW